MKLDDDKLDTAVHKLRYLITDMKKDNGTVLQYYYRTIKILKILEDAIVN